MVLLYISRLSPNFFSLSFRKKSHILFNILQIRCVLRNMYPILSLILVTCLWKSYFYDFQYSKTSKLYVIIWYSFHFDISIYPACLHMFLTIGRIFLYSYTILRKAREVSAALDLNLILLMLLSFTRPCNNKTTSYFQSGSSLYPKFGGLLMGQLFRLN